MTTTRKDVHLYLTVRVKVCNVPGDTDEARCEAARAAIDPDRLFNRVLLDTEALDQRIVEGGACLLAHHEFADEITGALVDTVIDGDLNEAKSVWLDAQFKPQADRYRLLSIHGDTVPELQPTEATSFDAILDAARALRATQRPDDCGIYDGLFYVVQKAEGGIEVGAFTGAELYGTADDVEGA
jgi:hypothetical protein